MTAARFTGTSGGGNTAGTGQLPVQHTRAIDVRSASHPFAGTLGAMGDPDLVIDCERLTRSFPSGIALDALTLDAKRGEVLALLGPNGAGKTTTMRLLNGVLTADSGRARVLGLDPWTRGEELRARTGVLTENAGLDERFTALENLEFVGRLRGMSESQARARGGELLERFDMGHRADVKVQGFSTGQRKRVALARALLHDPELLFLDEPTSGLDPAATRDVVDLIGSLAADHGRTVVLVHPLPGRGGQAGQPHGGAVPRRAPRVRHPRRAGRRAVVHVRGPARPGRTGRAAAASPRSTGSPTSTPAVRHPDGATVFTGVRDDVPAIVATCVSAGFERVRRRPPRPQPRGRLLRHRGARPTTVWPAPTLDDAVAEEVSR